MALYRSKGRVAQDNGIKAWSRFMALRMACNWCRNSHTARKMRRWMRCMGKKVLKAIRRCWRRNVQNRMSYAGALRSFWKGVMQSFIPLSKSFPLVNFKLCRSTRISRALSACKVCVESGPVKAVVKCQVLDDCRAALTGRARTELTLV